MPPAKETASAKKETAAKSSAIKAARAAGVFKLKSNQTRGGGGLILDLEAVQP